MNRDFVQVGKGFPELKAWALAWRLQIRELYGRIRKRLRHVPGLTERAAAESALRDHVANMAVRRDIVLADEKLCSPWRTSLAE